MNRNHIKFPKISKHGDPTAYKIPLNDPNSISSSPKTLSVLSLPLGYCCKLLSVKRAMARKLSTVMLSLSMMFLLLVQNNATITEAPTPQPQQSTNGSPMHGVTQGSLHPQECAPRCTTRCSKTAYKKPCMFFCQKCCAKCLCVPPGTYGNKQFCPCYNNWKTKRGGPKCP